MTCAFPAMIFVPAFATFVPSWFRLPGDRCATSNLNVRAARGNAPRRAADARSRARRGVDRGPRRRRQSAGRRPAVRKYPPPPGASDIPGLEVAGTFAASATGVTAGRGRRRLRAGCRRRLRRQVRRAAGAVPADTRRAQSMIEAAGIPETFFTVWTNVFERGRLQRANRSYPWRHQRHRHDRDSARAARGARVLATAGTEEKCAAAAGSAPSRRGTIAPTTGWRG